MHQRGEDKVNTYNSFRFFLWIEWTAVYEVWEAREEVNNED